MIIDFEEKDHCYFVNGEIAHISTTELLSKHGLAPNYSRVNKEVMKKSAEKGKMVHKDLENVLMEKNYTPTTKQGENYQKWVAENLDCGTAEQLLAIAYNGITITGTADVMGILKTGEYLVADHKNTVQFHREYVSWQVSILDYMARKLGKEKINNKSLNWKGATKFFCFHYDTKTGEMAVEELEKVSDIEIERLFYCESVGEIYQRPALQITKELEKQLYEAEMVLLEVQDRFKEAEENAKKLREVICNLMEEQKIHSWTTPDGLITVTHTPASESFRVDSTKLRREYPLVYEKVVKPTKRKAYVTITNRAGEV